MNFEFDENFPLYKEFQHECSRMIYLDHDVENHGDEEKIRLRKEFSRRFVRSNPNRSNEGFRCRFCQKILFNDVDFFQHPVGQRLFDWFQKFNDEHQDKSQCQEHFFTNLLDWLIEQIDVPSNPHGGSIKCPQCSTVIGQFDLNGKKCFCAAWLVPGVRFDPNQIERIPKQ